MLKARPLSHSLSKKFLFDNKTSLTQLISMTLPGWFFASVVNEVFITDLAALFGTVLMFLWIWAQLGDQLEMIRFVRMGAAMLVFIQNLGWLISSLISKSLNISIEVSLSKQLGGGLTLVSYCISIIYITCFALFLSYFGEKKWILKAEIELKRRILIFQQIKLQKLAIILILIIAAEIILIASGIIGQRTLKVTGFDKGEMPAWLVFYESLLPLHVFLNSVLFSLLWKKQIRVGKKVLWIILIGSFLTIFFLYFNKGRSTMTFSLIAHAYWVLFFLKLKPHLLKITILFILVYPVISEAFLLNNFIRSSASGLTETRGSAIDVVPKAWKKFQQSEKLRVAEGVRTKTNLSTRPLVATPLALCIQLPVSKKSFTFGQDILHSIIWVIPGPLFPNKKDFPKQEDLLYANFPIGNQDTADSLYLSSYVDFGWFGILIYPFLLALFWYAILSLCQSIKLSPFLYAMIITTFLSLFFLGIGEASVSKWLVAFRSILFWFMFFYLSQKILRIRAPIFKKLSPIQVVNSNV